MFDVSQAQTADGLIAVMESIWAMDLTDMRTPAGYDTWHNAHEVAIHAGWTRWRGQTDAAESGIVYDSPNGGVSRVWIASHGGAIRKIRKQQNPRPMGR